MTDVPVMEIGGTHVTVAVFDPVTRSVDDVRRVGLDAAAPAPELVDVLVRCASSISVAPGATWGVALPGPFDYDNGIGRFHGVGKFDALNGFDLGTALRKGLPESPAGIRFLNDAHAFGLGEWASGTMAGQARALALTLGTGIGSAFVADGVVVSDGPSVPPEGRVDLLTIDGLPLEETVSRRAILAAYGRPAVDVADVAAAARSGEAEASEVLRSAFQALGSALRPWVDSFGATIVVVGGSMAGSWDLIAPPLTAGLGEPRVVPARCGDQAALIGAGLWVSR